MEESCPPVVIGSYDPGSPEAQRCLAAYFAELRTRFTDGFDPGEDDLDAFRPPKGAFLLAVSDGAPLACGAIQTFDPATDEIKRMWVDPAARGRGIGGQMLRALEAAVARRGRQVVRLDTNDVLDEALGMYRSAGYVEIERYNDNPYARHWFEKALAPGGP